MFISLGEGVIYSSDPDAREPCTATGGSGGVRRRRQKAHSGGGPEEARNCGRVCSVSQVGERAGRGRLVPRACAGGSPMPALQEDAGAAPVLLPGGAGRAGRELLFLVLPVGRGW